MKQLEEEENSSFLFNNYDFVHNSNGGSMKKLKLFLLISLLLSPFSVYAIPSYVIPGGENIGIKVNSDGLLISGFYKVNKKYNYGSLEVGDYILEVDDKEVKEVSDFIKLIKNKTYITLTVKRDGEVFKEKLNIINGKPGLYLKDEVIGIGTLTYIDPETNIYGALGHEIIDNNSKDTFELSSGEIFKSNVFSIDRSINGKPGTKNAKFYYEDIFGDIDKNTKYGIYGTYSKDINNELIEVGSSDDIKLGKASIITVLDNNKKEEYEIKITKIDKYSDYKNIHFEIIDKEIIDECGGIVQGMSGSPIIQDNKIIGAVTHVVVDNVKKGYGVFITTMLETGEE